MKNITKNHSCNTKSNFSRQRKQLGGKIAKLGSAETRFDRITDRPGRSINFTLV